MVLMPSCAGTVARKLLPLTGAAIPLINTCAAGSTTVPVTLIGLWLNRAEFTGDVIVICGGFTKATVVVAKVEFPAASNACTWIEFVPATSGRRQLNDDPVKVAGLPPHVTVANPEMESLTVPVSVMLETLTVVPGAGETIVTTGGVLSRLTVLCVLAVLPAMSAAVPVMT
jgi:hypothetical protein